MTHYCWAGACEAGEGDPGGVQQLLHGESGGQLQGQRLPLHAAGVRHGRGALHISTGAPAYHKANINRQPAVELKILFLGCTHSALTLMLP